MAEYNIYFQSGSTDQVNYTDGSKITNVEITNSDQSYFQNGVVTLFDEISSQSIGNSILIKIKDTAQFDGYIARKQQEIKHGKKFVTYQLVGKTYDLWRYVIDSEESFSNQTTAYIASSLVGKYIDSSAAMKINVDLGTNISEIEFDNVILGDALVSLTEHDGYKFYMNFSGQLQYRPPGYIGYRFTVNESDIIDMSPIEEADEDLINDVMVIGGTGYSQKTTLDSYGGTYSNPSSAVFPSDRIVAQRFKAAGSELSAVKLWLNRSTDPDQPESLDFEIWGNTSTILYDDDFDNEFYISSDSISGMKVVDSKIRITDSGSRRTYGFHMAGGPNNRELAWAVGFRCTGNFLPTGTRKLTIHPAGTFRSWVLPTGSTGEPDDTIKAKASGISTETRHGYSYLPYTYTTELQSGTTYAVIYAHSWNKSDTKMEHDVAGNMYSAGDYIKGNWYWNGSSWVDYGNTGWGWFIYGKSAYTASGQLKSRKIERTCRYLKVDTYDVVSSQCIKISGTNNGLWKSSQTLIPGEWYDFEYESSDGVIIQYKMTGNLKFSPSIGRAVVTVADSSGGFDEILFTDEFTKYTTSKIIRTSNEMQNIKIDEGVMQLDDDDYRAGYFTIGVNSEAPRQIHGQMFHCFYTARPSSCWSGWGGGPHPTSDKCYFIIVPTGSHHKPNISTAAWICSGSAKSAHTMSCIFSSNGTKNTNLIYSGLKYALVCLSDWDYTQRYGNFEGNLWGPAPDLPVEWRHPHHATGGAFFMHNDGLNWQRHSYGGHDFIYSTNLNVKIYTDKYAASGVIEGTTYNETARYLKATVTDLDVPDTCKFGISGTLTDGDEWVTMTNGEWYDFGFTCDSGHRIKYVMSGNRGCTPSIGSCTFESRQIVGGGQPKSGSHADGGKLEFSDDISWTYQDVPYAPSWTAWTGYTSPKLRLDEDNYYWMVFYNFSGSNKWWEYWYDPNSTYADGKMMHSWNLADKYKVRWSGNVDAGIHVMPGNMRFELGWTEGEIVATSSNAASISNFGRHFKKISDSTILTQVDADHRAYIEVSGSQNVKKKGTVTIIGRTDMSTEYRFSSNLPNFGISSIHDIISYTQRIDHNGFTTTINYGVQPFDITKRVSDLEREVL